MALTGRTVWRRQAIIARIQQALNAFMTLQKVDWDYDVRTTLDEILGLAVKELDMEGDKEIERALLIVTPQSGGPLEVRAGYQTDEDVSFSRTIVQETIGKGQPVLCTNAREDPRFCNAESIRSLEVLSCISVPLRAEHDILGAVYVESRSPRGLFVEEDLAFLEEFARAVTPYAKTALTHERHVREIRKLRDEVAQRFGFQNIIGRSPAMERLFELVRIASQGDQLVLITGESGSGKELLARAVHHNGTRRERPFIVVDCSALTDQLLESELFGHVRGAFTGASAEKTGAFEEANGGTVFLDEISDASKPLQQKLRRVLQEGEIRPVGSAAFKKVDVRVIAATNKDLRKEMEENRFLRDLYFRLNRFPIAVPPLRERVEDIPLLALHFLEHAPQRRGTRVTGIAPDALQYLLAQRWQDNNVRELRNVIELACDLASGDQIDREALRRVSALLGAKTEGQTQSVALSVPMEELVAIDERRFDTLFAGDDAKPFRMIEREFMGKVIIATLKRCDWKLRRAAKLLGLSPGKVRQDLREYLKANMASDKDGAALATKLSMPAEILARKIADLGLEEG